MALINQRWIRFLPAPLRAKVEGRAYLQNVVNNTGWQIADNVVRMTVGLVVGIYLARYLGPEQFGLFSYAQAFVVLFGALASLGMEDIIVRDIVNDPESRNAVLGSAFLLRTLGSICSFVAAVGAIRVVRPGDPVTHWLVAIIAAGAFPLAFNVIETWFHSQVQARYSVMAKGVAFLAGALARVGVILCAFSVLALGWVYLGEMALGAVGLIVAYRTTTGRVGEWRFTVGRAGQLLRNSWPLMAASMVIMVYLRIDQVMLGQLAGNEEVGIYSVAVRLAEVWMFVPTVIYWSVFPAIVEAKSMGEELFYGRLQQFYNLAALAAYAVAIPVALLAKWLVPALFGDAYVRGGLVLAVLIWTNLFTGLEIARSAFLTTMNWNRLYLVTVVLGCVMNIVLNLVLIPRYGSMGAVVASLVSYWFAVHGSCFLFPPLRRTGSMLTRAIVAPRIW